MKYDTYVVTFDWSDIDEAVNSFRQALEYFGVKTYELPSFEGTNMAGYILSPKPLNEKQIKKIDDEGSTIFRQNEEDVK